MSGIFSTILDYEFIALLVTDWLFHELIVSSLSDIHQLYPVHTTHQFRI